MLSKHLILCRPLLLWPSVFHCGSVGKESDCNVGDLGSIPVLERSPGEGKGYPLQYSGLESYRGHKESDTTERLPLHFTSSIMSSHIKMYLYKSYLYKQDYTIDVFQNAFSFFHSRLCLFVYVPRVRLFSYPEAIGHLFLP